MTVLILLEDNTGGALGAIADTMGSFSAPVDLPVPREWWLPSTGIIQSPLHRKDPQRYPVALLRKFVDIRVPRSEQPLRALVCGDTEAAYIFKDVVEEVSHNGQKGLRGALRDRYNPELPEAILSVCLEVFQQRSERPLAYAIPLPNERQEDSASLKWITGMTRRTSANGDVAEVIKHTPYFGRVRLLATGAHDLSERIAVLAERYAFNDGDDQNEHLKRLVRGIYSIPSVLLDEDASPRTSTLINAVGGYYEGYIAENGRLEDAGPSITLFIKVEEDLKTVSMEALFLHAYIDDDLHVVSVPPCRPIDLQNGAIPWSVFTLAKISPLRARYPSQQPLTPSLADQEAVQVIAKQCISRGAFRLRMRTSDSAMRWTTLPGSVPDAWRLILTEDGLKLDHHGGRLKQKINRLVDLVTTPEADH